MYTVHRHTYAHCLYSFTSIIIVIDILINLLEYLINYYVPKL